MSVPRPDQPSMGPYAMVPGWVLTMGLTGSELAVYVALRLHCDRERRAWPSQDLLAEETLTTVRTVERALARLRQLGVIEIERVVGFGSGSRNIYTLFDLPLPDILVGQLPDRAVGQLPDTAVGSYPTRMSLLPDEDVGQKGTNQEQTIEQSARAREAPPDLPLTGSAAPAGMRDRTNAQERAGLDDSTVRYERAVPPDSTVRAERRPPFPAGSATKYSPTMWVTQPDWAPPPEFDPVATRAGLAAARAAVARAVTANGTVNQKRTRRAKAPEASSESMSVNAPSSSNESKSTAEPLSPNEPCR